MIVVNAEGLVVGRVASFCAKKALQKEEVMIVNAEKAVLTGNKRDLLKKYKTRLDLAVKGNPRNGPKASRMPDRMLRRAIRGMLPGKTRTGKEALARVSVFIGVPEKANGKEFAEIKGAEVDASRNFIVLGELTKLLGAKW